MLGYGSTDRFGRRLRDHRGLRHNLRLIAENGNAEFFGGRKSRVVNASSLEKIDEGALQIGAIAFGRILIGLVVVARNIDVCAAPVVTRQKKLPLRVTRLFDFRRQHA